MVLIFWLMIMAVRSLNSRYSASTMRLSVVASSDEVTSSRTMISGFAAMARAMATRCRWPPERPAPRSPTEASQPSGFSLMNSSAQAISAARSRSDWLASGALKATFSRIVPLKSTVSCRTIATRVRRVSKVRSRTSISSMKHAAFFRIVESRESDSPGWICLLRSCR